VNINHSGLDDALGHCSGPRSAFDAKCSLLPEPDAAGDHHGSVSQQIAEFIGFLSFVHDDIPTTNADSDLHIR
jgi:hypothetical protein